MKKAAKHSNTVPLRISECKSINFFARFNTLCTNTKFINKLINELSSMSIVQLGEVVECNYLPVRIGAIEHNIC